MTFTILRLGHLGDGIAEGPDGPLFAAGALPGEVVAGTVTGDRLTDLRIVTPVTGRVRPPCAHARTCGGCSMQHAGDDLVARWKEGIVAGALAGQGLTAPVLPILTSPPASRRRATLSARRTKSGALAGFHMKGSDTIIPVPGCRVLHPGVMAALPAVEDLARIGGSRTGEMSVTVTIGPAGPDIAVTGGKPADAALRLGLARLAEAQAVARLTWDGETVALRAPPFQAMGRARVVPPPGAFLQATAEGESALVAAVRRIVGDAARVADLFAGCGTFALPLAEGAEVHAVEGDAAMVAALDRAWRQTPGLRRVTTEARDLFRRPLEPGELAGFDAVVIDPPRAGAEAQTDRIARARVPVVAMISCNAATFARDARRLVQAGYVPEWVQPVDQFRWSPHVELAAAFRLADKTRAGQP
ncbi:MAG: class I SAM-dependent RNA methyltransferase [Paracoccaceae bacterium]|nr:MAG: class I SAM-dependent RNA methyltransferase [Paracoccaceae bacterium]